jgi:hypothetical protein
MKNIKTIFRMLLIAIFLGQSLQAQYCNKPNDNFCSGNYFTNGDFETVKENPDNNSIDGAMGDQDIAIATGWNPIWSGGSLADLYCPTTAGTGNPPTPASGVYASMWVGNRGLNSQNFREGMFNKLKTVISKNSGNYSFNFKTAKLQNNGTNNLQIGIYGVYYTGSTLPDAPTSETFPTNINLFNGVGGTVVLLGTITIPNNATNVWKNQTITFNSSIFPSNSITHILVTSSDTVTSGGISYMAFDEFCLKVCNDCGGYEETWDTNVPKDCFCCDKAYNLPTKPQIAGLEKVDCGASAQYSTSNCPGATTTWSVSPSIPFTGQGTNSISFNSIPAGSYTLSLTISCGKKRYTNTKTITALAPLNCSPSFLLSVVQMPNGLLNINATPTTTAGVEHYWGISYNGTFPNCAAITPILLNEITGGTTSAGGHVSTAGIFTQVVTGTGVTGGTAAPYGFFYGGFPNNSCFKVTHYVKCCGVWSRQTQYGSMGTSNARMANGATVKPEITVGAIEVVQ